jgi:hypothetical protein
MCFSTCHTTFFLDRTCGQQHLLYQWYLRRQCGITAAAQPVSGSIDFLFLRFPLSLFSGRFLARLAQICVHLADCQGGSNHESGLAIDTSSYNYWMNALTSNGWRWYGSGDAVHFDYVGSGSVDLRRSVLEHDGVGGRVRCLLLVTATDSDLSLIFLSQF